MVQSLVDDATQNGWLPKWAIVDGDESQMNGDSADPIIAAPTPSVSADFDATGGPGRPWSKAPPQNETGHGLEIERQYLDQYETQHYVNAGSLDLTSIDYSMGASGTLEYALDDFSIARMAAALADPSLRAVDDAEGPQLGVPVRPVDRHPPGSQRRRQLPRRTRLPDRPPRARWGGRVRRGQRRPVHVVGPSGPVGPGHPDGGRRHDGAHARHLLQPPERHARRALRLGRQRAEPRDAVGVRRLRRTLSQPRRWCAPSPTPCTPTPRSTSPATTIWAPSPPGTCGRRSGCTRSPREPPTWRWPAPSSPRST